MCVKCLAYVFPRSVGKSGTDDLTMKRFNVNLLCTLIFMFSATFSLYLAAIYGRRTIKFTVNKRHSISLILLYFFDNEHFCIVDCI